MHFLEFLLLVLTTIAAIAAGLAVIAANYRAARILFWIAALAFGALGVVWSLQSPEYSFASKMIVSFLVAGIAGAGLMWGLTELSERSPKEDAETGQNLSALVSCRNMFPQDAIFVSPSLEDDITLFLTKNGTGEKDYGIGRGHASGLTAMHGRVGEITRFSFEFYAKEPAVNIEIPFHIHVKEIKLNGIVMDDGPTIKEIVFNVPVPRITPNKNTLNVYLYMYQVAVALDPKFPTAFTYNSLSSDKRHEGKIVEANDGPSMCSVFPPFPQNRH